MIKPMSSMDLEDALDVLDDCSALILDDDILMYPRIIKDLKNEDNQKIFCLQWTEGEDTFEIVFVEEDNQSVGYSGSTMFLIDDNDQEVHLTLLTEKAI
jgi:hypothetical protein